MEQIQLRLTVESWHYILTIRARTRRQRRNMRDGEGNLRDVVLY
jgi:hypothetical protein